jgi:hypothetical protein
MSDYIVVEGGKFYFWDDQDELIGPFNSLEQCEVAHTATLRWEAKDHQPRIKKMRDDMGL